MPVLGEVADPPAEILPVEDELVAMLADLYASLRLSRRLLLSAVIGPLRAVGVASRLSGSKIRAWVGGAHLQDGLLSAR